MRVMLKDRIGLEGISGATLADVHMDAFVLCLWALAVIGVLEVLVVLIVMCYSCR